MKNQSKQPNTCGNCENELGLPIATVDGKCTYCGKKIASQPNKCECSSCKAGHKNGHNLIQELQRQGKWAPSQPPEEGWSDDRLWNSLAEILNQLPHIDPFDDESEITDKCFPKFKSFISSLLAETRREVVEEILNLSEEELFAVCEYHKTGIPTDDVTRNKIKNLLANETAAIQIQKI